MGTSARTIEEFVDEIVETIDNEEFCDLEDLHETLTRMKDSVKNKHKLNFYRVIQCLGEVATDKVIDILIKQDKLARKTHDYFNVNILMELFVDLLSNVCVIKRVLHRKNKVVPVLFHAVRQKESGSLVQLGVDAMLKCLVVGKLDVAELYLKLGLMKVVQSQLQIIFRNPVCFHYMVLSCTLLLLYLAELGQEEICTILRRSAATRMLGDYVVKFNQKANGRCGDVIEESYSVIITLVHDLKASREAFQNWDIKKKMRQLASEETLVCCSAPSCRKLACEGLKFRYCGACKLSRYCSEECQKKHWRGGHKESCLKSPP